MRYKGEVMGYTNPIEVFFTSREVSKVFATWHLSAATTKVRDKNTHYSIWLLIASAHRTLGDHPALVFPLEAIAIELR
jgi:hypothetical protein